MSNSKNENAINERGNRPPLFRTMNYILMGIGALLLLIGYICLAGGDVPDEVFDGEVPEVFDMEST